MKAWLLKILIRLLVKETRSPLGEKLSKEVEDGLLSQLWENPVFRRRIADREGKIIYAMAGGEGFEAEPRGTYMLHLGQRVEVLLWARDAKAAYVRRQKVLESERDLGEG